MAAPRILTFNFHEPYLCLMARTGMPFVVGEYDRRPLARKWYTRYRPIPPSFTFLEERAWRRELAQGRFDAVIAQNETNAANICKQVVETRTPLILVCHNRRSFLETTIQNSPAQHETFQRLIETLREFAEFVFISETKRDDYGLPGRVIRPGIDVEEYGGYTGEIPAVIRVGNCMRMRNRMFDVDFQEQVCAGFANRIVGDNPDIPESQPAESFDELRAIYRTHRCYLHVTREEYEDGYNLALLEAMATGMPVVSLANPTSPLTDGVDGLLSYEPVVLREHVKRLLEDISLAREIGARARETVARAFPLESFVEKWRETILSAAERSPRRPTKTQKRVVTPAVPANPLPATEILLHYMASPVTTGRYFEQALRKRHHVVTAGFRCPEALLTRWGFPPDAPDYPPHDIEASLNTSYKDILEALPKGFSPHLYLWVDSGPKQIAPDIQRLAMPKACYLIDTHLAPQIRIEIARHFDFVFLAQKAQVPLFQDAGIANVYWLPLACSPELHDVGSLERRHDVGYIGRVQDDPHERRRRLLARVRERFPNHVTGQQWPADMARTYAQSKIVINAAVQNDLNMRVFEAMASGALLITDSAEGLVDLFEEGTHFVLYHSENELCELIEHYLHDGAARERIAQQGQEFVLNHHTYEQRMEQLLGCVFEAAGLLGGLSGESRYHYGGYYCSPRAELAVHVPRSAKRILDIGCGAGAFGRSLKERGAGEVIGIEIEERACAIAREALDGVLCGDIERMELPFEPEHFDCVTFGDVLEHLADPAKVLRRIAPFLAPGGLAIASIPNARFCQVVQMLAEGRWKYEDAGILDRTHLRFFTAVEMQHLFQEAGYDVIQMAPLSMLQPAQLPRNTDGGITLGRLTVGPLDDAEYQDFLVYQYLVAARKSASGPLDRARAAMSENRYEQAYGIAASADHADESERKFVMGQALGRMGRLDAAEAALREAHALAPGRNDILGQLGVLLVAMNRNDEALPCLEQAVTGDPADYRALGAWGLALLAGGDPEGAFERLRASLELHFDNAALMEQFVSLGETMEKPEGVEPILRRFVDFYPGNTAMTIRFARVLMRLGKREEARERLETLLIFEPANNDVRRLLEEMPGT
ncbi:MAG TPA: glycosyltransferase [Candidatus Hydrogenedentes bacterium]|nr:glycosyltransferase [Candidatus Hydrogenedentota bacterium]HQH52164.1 glycosyltransferase [Candidatus Hydrogenedentota bacterium]